MLKCAAENENERLSEMMNEFDRYLGVYSLFTITQSSNNLLEQQREMKIFASIIFIFRTVF